MKFLHSSDWHLGRGGAVLGDRAGAARAERRGAVARLLDLALEEAVDLVLVAGDVFDSPDADRDELRWLLGALERLEPLPIVLLPGNHDPDLPAGVWQRPDWRDAGEHVRVARSAEPMELGERLVVYPCPLDQKQSRRDPTRWIPPREPDDERVRIGLAHGSLDSLGVARNFPIAGDRRETAGLDYLALGDWHGCQVRGRIAYSGAPESTAFGEDSGFVLLGEIRSETPQRELVLERRRVGRLRWLEREETVRDRSDLDALRRRVADAGPVADAVLRLRLALASEDGALRESCRLWLAELQDKAFSVDAELRDERRIVADYPPGLLERLDGVLRGLETQGPPPGDEEATLAEAVDLEDLDPGVVAEAREQLRRAWAAVSGGSS